MRSLTNEEETYSPLAKAKLLKNGPKCHRWAFKSGSIAYELPQSRGNLIADLPEYHGLLVSGGGCRVLKAMVQPPACTGENGARLLRVVTHRKNVIELLSRKLVY